VNNYDKLLARKRSWTPVQTTAGQLIEGSEGVIKRALALRQLELPVGGFIESACRGDIPETSRALLLSNIQDEEKHDLALGYAAKALGVDPAAEAEAARLVKAWEEHPDHTVMKALVLERSLFFVILPMFRWLGDPGLRTVSSDISRDEQVHVATNTLVCQELGLKVSRSLDILRKATLQWMLEPLSPSNSNRWLSRTWWAQQSDSLMYSGKADGLIDSANARLPAFFEHSNTNLPMYV
jgi:hypothetical protein